MHPKRASFLSIVPEQTYHRSKIRPNHEDTRHAPNTAEQYLTRRDPRSAASVPRTAPNGTEDSRRHDFSV